MMGGADIKLNLLLGLIIVVLVLVSLTVGPVPLGAPAWHTALSDPRSVEATILFEIRLPRALLAPLVGAALGLSGAALQGLLRNPLAEPSVFGAPQAAALGAVLAIFFVVGRDSAWPVPLAAIAGALISVAILVGAAGRGAPVGTLLIVGLVLASAAGALLALALTFAPNPFALSEIVFWLVGSLADRSFDHLSIAAPPILIGALLVLSTGRALSGLALGEAVAQSLGVDLAGVRVRVALGVALMVGGSVAVAGSIGFVGLMSPHLVRAFVGHDPGRVLPASALAAAALVLAADVAARLIPAPSEVKVGMVTALIGLPVFVVLLLRHRRRVEAAA